MSGSLLSAFNQQACDFLKDLGVVFPDDQWIAKAVHLLNSAIAMDERSWVPMAAFMAGEPTERWTGFPRKVFEIPGNHMALLHEEMSESNRQVVMRYMQNLSTIAHRMQDQNKELNQTISNMKQSDAFADMLSMVNDFNNNPASVLQALTGGDGGNGAEQMAESLAQNPHIAQMVQQVAEKVDVSQLASMLPLLGGAGLQPPQ